jgi:hypothetical protein
MEMPGLETLYVQINPALLAEMTDPQLTLLALHSFVAEDTVPPIVVRANESDGRAGVLCMPDG